MSFLTGLATSFLSLYLAFTNFLADGILTLMPTEEKSVPAYEAEENDLTKIPSAYEIGGSIPDILIKNAAYQSAALSNAVYPESNATPLEAIVNIFCTYQTGNFQKTTTGTGFFIHPDGIILTNAHVAQFLLQVNITGNGDCIVRTGSPATPTYSVDLLYISPAWLREYAQVINDEVPKGTGERDYALLYVNGGLNNKPMPGKFPSVSFDTDLIKTSLEGQVITAAAYPAAKLHTEGGQVSLVPQMATSTVTELMTFDTSYADVFSISGSDLGESGASGGPVVDSDGQAIGMIVTKGDAEQFGPGSLRAITISYIDRTITEETGYSLIDNLSGNLPYRAKLYKKTMIPFLEQVLRWELDNE